MHEVLIFVSKRLIVRLSGIVLRCDLGLRSNSEPKETNNERTHTGDMWNWVSISQITLLPSTVSTFDTLSTWAPDWGPGARYSLNLLPPCPRPAPTRAFYDTRSIARSLRWYNILVRYVPGGWRGAPRRAPPPPPPQPTLCAKVCVLPPRFIKIPKILYKRW